MKSVLLALVGGALLPLAFAPFGYALVALLSLALLFRVWLNASPPRAAMYGYLFGLGQFGVGVSWVFISMHEFGGSDVFSAAGLTALFVAYLALFPALAGWLGVTVGGGSVLVRALLVFPAAWVVTEWLRGWLFSGFPWLQIGYSQTDTGLRSIAPVFGVFGVGWLLAVLAGLVLSAWLLDRRGRRLALLGAAVVLVGSTQFAKVQWTQPAGDPIRVTLLQGNVPQDQKWRPEAKSATVQMYVDMTRQHWDSRLIVWPETAVPAFYQQVAESFMAPLEAEARQHGVDILVGVPYYEAQGDRYYNAVVTLGAKPGRYFKRHLVPFGEFLPLRPVLGFVLDILQIPLADFTAGAPRQTLLQAAGYPLIASICYEDIFGQESLAGLPEGAYLVNVTNDAWFGDSFAPYQHWQKARMRALETGRYMLRATNTGVTGIIDASGKPVAVAPMFRREALTGMLQPMAGATPYALWGDWPAVGLCAGIIGACFFRRRRNVLLPPPRGGGS
ncbi:apolipoprotein N-acyltransferase [Methylococcus geothermalis]|uniref:Apolipoprotein N-acyltransferase n=1 Tax=Methylococcus geothermalis TaxID=2681310 RepID=A0A858Q8I5_9GAMM|nr:apolipoprotein N-acyltransferase [Methylococcus geothermalis]QJD30159.1 apolipoprotein N-acyltransferase [Methylococcus geothermalis]